VRPSFTRLPQRRDMVTEACPDRAHATDLLCVECGWQGHTEADAPLVVFMQHPCRLRTESVSTGDGR
jgi:hypothetical protein